MSRTLGTVCVIGAGIIGASTALHLVDAGVRDVVLIDAGEPLSGTTAAGAGFVARFAADRNRRLGDGAVPIADHSLAFYRELHESGADIEFAHNGNLVLARTAEALAALDDGIVRHPMAGAGTRTLTADEVAERSFGAVDPAQVVGGVLMPEAIQVTTARALEAILQRLDQAGVTMHWSTEATGFTTDGDAVTGVVTADGVIAADAVVMAAGAWTPALLATLGRRLPLVPTVATRFVSEPAGMPAQMPTFQCPELGLWLRELHGAFSWGGGFAYRRLSALAADEAQPGFARPVSDSLIRAQHAAQASIAEVFPALSGLATTDIIQGVPVYTVDGGLYAGALDGVDGLWVIAGDNESGVTHGPGLGRLVAQLVAGQEPYTDPRPFRLDRVDPADYPDEAAMVAEMGGDRVADALR